MKIRDILNKITKGEQLSDAEKTFCADYTEPNAEELRAQLAAEKAKGAMASDTIKGVREQIEALNKAIEKERSLRETASAEAAKMKRSADIDRIRTQANLNFIDGIDAEFTRGAFEKAFAKVEDLSNAEATASALESFKKANAGLIRVTPSGATPPVGSGFSGSQPDATRSDPAAMMATLQTAGLIKKI